jgi:predicted nucleic acid-binding protein
MTDYLVDNSAWARYILKVPSVVERIDRIVSTPSDLFVTCLPQVLEFCHSAPADRHDEYHAQITLGFPLEHHPDEGAVLGIQRALWNGGLHRAAGLVDILIAAYACLNDAVVVSCDRDFEHIAAVVPELRHEYLPPEPADERAG